MGEKERNDRQRARLSAAAAKGSPAAVFAVLGPLGNMLFVKRGELGHFEAPDPVAWRQMRDSQTQEVSDAALAGSMFGWHVPAAKAAME